MVGSGRRPAVLIDVGGVLLVDCLAEAASAWGERLGITPEAFLGALFAGNDDQVLIGRTSEAAWWRVVGGRLGVGEKLVAAIRADLVRRQRWNADLIAGLRGVRGRATITIVSNAWPDMRASLAGAGLLDLADTVVLSCEVGCAKPDRRIFAIALHSVGADPAAALFIDDSPGHVEAARSLGMAGHRHVHVRETLGCIEKFIGAS